MALPTRHSQKRFFQDVLKSINYTCQSYQIQNLSYHHSNTSSLNSYFQYFQEQPSEKPMRKCCKNMNKCEWFSLLQIPQPRCLQEESIIKTPMLHLKFPVYLQQQQILVDTSMHKVHHTKAKVLEKVLFSQTCL